MKLKIVINYLLLLYIFLLPIQTRYIYYYGKINGGSWEYGTLSLYATELLLWLIAVLYAVFIFRNKESIKVFTKDKLKKGWKFFLFVFLYLILNVAMVLTSLDPQISYMQFIRVLGAFALVVIVVGRGAAEGMRIKMLFALWLSAVVQAVLGGWQFLIQKVYGTKWLGLASQDPSDVGVNVVEFGDERWMRSYGSLGGANPLGAYLAVVFVLGIILRVKYCKTKLHNYLVTAGQCIILSGLLLSFSRGAWIAVVVGVILLTYFAKQCIKQLETYVRQLVYYIIILLVAIIILAPIFVARFNLDNRLEQFSIDERKAQLSLSAQLIGGRQMFGTGMGNYTLALLQQSPQYSSLYYLPVHNVYVLMLAEIGIIIFAFYFIIYLFFIKNIWLTNRLYIAVVVVLLVTAIFEHWSWSLYVGLYFWFLVWALGLSTNRSVQNT